MKDKAMSLKARIRNLAKEKNIAAQVVMQNYMFERFLEQTKRKKSNPFLGTTRTVALRRPIYSQRRNADCRDGWPG